MDYLHVVAFGFEQSDNGLGACDIGISDSSDVRADAPILEMLTECDRRALRAGVRCGQASALAVN